MRASANQSKKHYQPAFDLLKDLGLDYIRLERQCDSHHRYHAWSVPLVIDNGSPGRSKPGGRCEPEGDSGRPRRNWIPILRRQ
jgi:hypothetical protein